MPAPAEVDAIPDQSCTWRSAVAATAVQLSSTALAPSLCRPEVNQRISKTAHIKELNGEIDKLKAELYATREKNGVYLPSDQYDAQMVRLQLSKGLEAACTLRRHGGLLGLLTSLWAELRPLPEHGCECFMSPALCNSESG